MRISDWSSDVCSSDLAGRSQVLLRHPSARQRRLAREDRASADTARGTAFADQGQTVLRGLRVSGGVLGQAAPRHRQDRMASGRAVPQSRSEEHTSELQSLMRISYAVFCLKKKKNKNQNK